MEFPAADACPVPGYSSPVFQSGAVCLSDQDRDLDGLNIIAPLLDELQSKPYADRSNDQGLFNTYLLAAFGNAD